MSPQIIRKHKIINDNEEDNLNIIGLRPKTSDYKKIDRNIISNLQFQRN
jgi:hypothetical protein